MIRPIPAILLIAVVSGCASNRTVNRAVSSAKSASSGPATCKRARSTTSPVIRPPSRMAISMVARRQKNLPTAPRTRAACLPIRNIASGGMTASACAVESSNSARPENVKRVRRYRRCLPLNTRQWRRFAASCVYGHGHGMCGVGGPRLKGEGKHEVSFRSRYVFFSTQCWGSADTCRETGGGSSVCSAGLRYNCFFYRFP